MLKPGFAPSTLFRHNLTRPYRWACSASPRGSWDLAPREPARERVQRSYRASPPDREARNYRQSTRDTYDETRRRDSRENRDSNRRDRDTHTRRPSTNPETLLLRATLDSSDELLYGINPVLQALQSFRRPHFTRVFTQSREKSSLKQDNQASLNKILTIAAEREIPVVEVSKGSLNALTKDRPHQGVVLATAPLPVQNITRLELSSGVWVALDEVTDPHNVGAIVRSAVFLGADGVLLCRKNCCGVTPAVSKASVGGVESCDVRFVSSMPRFLRAAKQDGWSVVGLGVEGGVELADADVGGGVILVVGSEGEGMRRMVRDECEKIVRISGGGDCGVESLNVSVATGVALFKLLSR